MIFTVWISGSRNFSKYWTVFKLDTGFFCLAFHSIWASQFACLMSNEQYKVEAVFRCSTGFDKCYGNMEKEWYFGPYFLKSASKKCPCSLNCATKQKNDATSRLFGFNKIVYFSQEINDRSWNKNFFAPPHFSFRRGTDHDDFLSNQGKFNFISWMVSPRGLQHWSWQSDITQKKVGTPHLKLIAFDNSPNSDSNVQKSIWDQFEINITILRWI